jgi:nucleoside-diphosphate-sugar epimerase
VRALVLGGTSFVGGRTATALVTAGHEVTVLNRGRTGRPPDGTRLIVGDRRDPGSMRDALGRDEWDAVIDVSGFVMTTEAAAFDDLLAVLDGRIGRYVFVSSIMVYEPSGFLPWHEDDPLRDDPATTYGGFKVHAEQALFERHAADGFPATTIRPASIYGPDNNIYDMEAAMFHRLQRGLPVLLPHDGLVTTSYGHVDDLVTALVTAAMHPAAVGEAFNVTGEGVTSGQYIRTLAEIVGVDPEVVPVPSELLDADERPAVGHLFRARHHGTLANDKYQRLLGLPPGRDFRTGHEQTYAWFRASPLAEESDRASDPLWGAGFDLAHEQELVDAIRGRT